MDINQIQQALAEAPDEFFVAINEFYEDATMQNPCSHGYATSAKLIGSIVIRELMKHEKAEESGTDNGKPDDFKSELIERFDGAVRFV